MSKGSKMDMLVALTESQRENCIFRHVAVGTCPGLPHTQISDDKDSQETSDTPASVGLARLVSNRWWTCHTAFMLRGCTFNSLEHSGREKNAMIQTHLSIALK